MGKKERQKHKKEKNRTVLLNETRVDARMMTDAFFIVR